MSHTYTNGSSTGNSFLNKKRLDEDIQMDDRYHCGKYEKFDKYGNHGRYNNMNYSYSKPLQGNSYYNTGSRYRGNHYNKPFHGNYQPNKLGPKRDYKKPYQKYSNSNANEGIRNLSHCEMPSPKRDSESLKSAENKSNSIRTISSNNGINLKDLNLNKFVSNINGIPNGRGHPIFNQQNINIAIKLTSPPNLKYKDSKISEYKEENKKWKKDEEEDEEIPIFKCPKLPEKLTNYEPFNRNSVKIEENPIENFEIYPKNLYEVNINNLTRKFNNSTIRDSINNDNIENALSIKSCYLLAKIRNWRLVTNFVPASALTEEKFKNIIPLDEEKEENGQAKKSYLVYSEKFEEIVDKSLEQIMHKKKQAKKDIFNKKYIIAQFHYDILKLKNKIKQYNYKVDFLNIKQENIKNVLDENHKE